MADPRRRILIDRKFQLQYLYIWLWVGIGMIGMCFLFYLLGQKVLGERALDAAFVRLMSGMSGFVILCCVLMGIISVFLTHRVAGASYRLEKCIRALSEGNLDLRIALRTRDYLQNLAEALNELRDSMRTQAEQRTKTATALEGLRDGLEKNGKLDDAMKAQLTGMIEGLRKPAAAPGVDKEQSASV